MSRRVLVVDDETNIRRMMRLTLESDGYEVEDAEDGEKGLALFGDGTRFDAVLLDQKMPGMDGIETLRQIRHRAPGRARDHDYRLRHDRAGGGGHEGWAPPIFCGSRSRRRRCGARWRRRYRKRHRRRAPERVAAAPAAPAELPPVEIWTVNGFFIRSKPRPRGRSRGRASVRDSSRHPRPAGRGDRDHRPEGGRRESHGSPSGTCASAGAFWHQRAERAVVNYLFRHAALPPDNRLVVNHLQDDVVRLAAEWTRD